MDKLVYCVFILSFLLAGTLGENALEELKEKIYELLKKKDHTHSDVHDVVYNKPDHAHIHKDSIPEDVKKTGLEKRDWINYATEDELRAYIKITDARLAKMEGKVNTDYCADSPCLNYGDCENRLNGYECQCKPGFVGPICQIDTGSQPTETLSVNNGGNFGDWYPFDMCPAASFVTGFRIKLEKDQGPGDDTGMNAVQLMCRNTVTGEINANISSGQGVYGDWMEWQMCQNDSHLVNFAMKVEDEQGSYDDTSVNGLAMACRGPGFDGDHEERLKGPSGPWGQWGPDSKSCGFGEAICGVATRVESPQGGGGDDTALNDIKFKCCYWW